MKRSIASLVFAAVLLSPATSFASSRWSGRNTWYNGQHNGASSQSCNSGHTGAEAADWRGIGC